MSFLRELPSHFITKEEQSDLTDSQKRGRQIIENALGTIRDVENLKGGLIHHVYRIQGKERSGILKLRGTSFSAIPEIPTNPNDIEYEYRALQLLAQIEPTVFPHVLAYSDEEHFILMTDVMPNRRTLETDLEEKKTDATFIVDLSRTVARLHKKLKPFQDKWHGQDEDNIFKQDMYYRLGYHNNPALNETMRQVVDLPRQLILADLSPKNIGKNADDRVSICDLDAFCKGNVEYALSFLPGHLLLHNLTDFETASALITRAIEGFKSELPDIDFESMLFKRLVLGAVLYRIANTVIPYNVPYTEEIKSSKSQKVFDLLDEKDLSWITLISRMTSP